MPDTKPRLAAPPDACDCHIHIYDRTTPLAPTAVNVGPAWATVEAYRGVQRRLDTTRTVIVQPTAYGTDNRCTVAAIAALGIEQARGVAIVDEQVTDAELKRLTHAGIRGVRFHMLPGGPLPWSALEPLAARIAAFGWFVELQMDGRLLHEQEEMLKRLPSELLIDHVGKFLEPVPPAHPGFQALLRLLDTGRCWLKLAAPYETSRSGGPAYADVAALAAAAVHAAPGRCIWSSNWPHVGIEHPPEETALLDLLLDWAPDAAIRRRILVDNPATLYGF